MDIIFRLGRMAGWLVVVIIFCLFFVVLIVFFVRFRLVFCGGKGRTLDFKVGISFFDRFSFFIYIFFS